MTDIWRHAQWWAADYAYAVRRQLAGLLSRTGPATYSRPRQPRRPPVLILPGVYESWRFLEPLARGLYHHGHPVHVVAPLGFNRGSVPDMADLAAATLTETDLTGVVLIAHSKGGLIGKSLMGRPDVRDRVLGMVAVNSPFSGSPYARWLPLRSVRAFLPDDEVITALAAQQADNSRIVSAATGFDPHIPAGSELPGARNVRLATPGHFRALTDPELLPLLLRELDRFAVNRDDHA
ncbi:esterase/lipase family protein [Ruania halotolerans]|uniref:esterase/lipase family protein n=1 Tax=Ruania halotolerans TaxID=2897773 RepID=UPI001E5DEBFB|nr:alpha/beta hydrolase [Ruania halotolerans]UFU06961.1 alpha/beta hydrolase [Ruania halotolerans]